MPDSAAVRSLLEKGIITFRAGKTQRFCYHERAPRYDDCPGRWGVCHGGSFIAHSATVARPFSRFDEFPRFGEFQRNPRFAAR